MSSGGIVFYAWGAWALLASLAWVLAYAKGIWTMLTMPMLRDVDPREPTTWPRLSVVIPACNEADTLEPAIRTLLEQDYPDLEIVLIDDRSTDATGQLVDQLAQSDARVRPVHIQVLPEQWLGKVHALCVGCQMAQGEWLLLSDADVHHGPGLLRKAVALCEERKLGHLALFPAVEADGILHEAVVSAFGGFFLQLFNVQKVTDPTSDEYVGVGAFNLVRKSALEKTEGLEWLRMEVADDVGLGLMLKRSGARSAALFATEELSVTWYAGVLAMARGLEKNIYPIMGRYNPALFFARLGAMLFMVLGPFAGLLHPSPVAWFSLAAFVLLLPFAMVLSRVLSLRLGATLLIPLGQLILAGMAINSALKCLSRGEIGWRGTAYRLDELRKFQRVKR